MFNTKKFMSQVRKCDKKRKAERAELTEIEQMFNQAMTFRNTSEVDFEVFTPEKIVEIANYALGNAAAIGEECGKCHDFITEVKRKPTVARKRFGCCY